MDVTTGYTKNLTDPQVRARSPRGSPNSFPGALLDAPCDHAVEVDATESQNVSRQHLVAIRRVSN